MQIPIIGGIYTDRNGEVRVKYPINLVPVAQENGVSGGYLRPAEGILHVCDTQGADRGGINWRGQHFRVTGDKLVKISQGGQITSVGDVGEGGQVSFDYSFDRLAIASGGRLYYLDTDENLSQVTDVDLGDVVDMIWIDGYFMTTDGEFIIVTELNNPASVNPLKYGSSEIDPDPVVALLKLKAEVHVVNRYTIETFTNVGGVGFPFQRVEGAQVMRGAIGTHACCVFMDSLAFIGSGRNESIGVYLADNSQSVKISSREIDLLLMSYTEQQLAAMTVESRVEAGYEHLLVHLPDRTLVHDSGTSRAFGRPVWFTLTSSARDYSTYRARNFVWVYNSWFAGDPTGNMLGRMTTESAEHYGERVRWEVNTGMLYNGGISAVIHKLELVALTGRASNKAIISTAYSIDGEKWSIEKSIDATGYGNTAKRLAWFNQGLWRNIRIQRFSGDSSAFLTLLMLDAVIEPMGV